MPSVEQNKAKLDKKIIFWNYYHEKMLVHFIQLR